MSGHSKWAQIKRQKAVTDTKKGQMFTKLGREITVAAREGGPDPEANYRLRLAIERARDANMPWDNIERAIKRASGAGEVAALEQITYEGYGPGGAALMVEVTTDSRNRAAAEVRNVFTRGGGNLGESGCVVWLFEPRGIIVVQVGDADPEEVALAAIDAGAEDVQIDGRVLEIYTQSSDLSTVRQKLSEMSLMVTSAEMTMRPKTSLPLDEKQSEQLIKLMDRLEELDDVQRVYTNAEFALGTLEKYAGP